MKKLFAILLTLLLALAVTACGGTGAEESAPQDLDLETVYQNILTAIDAGEDLTMFPESSPDVIASFYEGLEAVELAQQVYYIHPVTGFACEIMLVEAADQADVQTITEIFESRIALGRDDTFYPETAALWQTNAQVQSAGNYVCMIALPEGYEIPGNVFEA